MKRNSRWGSGGMRWRGAVAVCDGSGSTMTSTGHKVVMGGGSSTGDGHRSPVDDDSGRKKNVTEEWWRLVSPSLVID